MKTAGIDGCAAGWLYISFDEGDETYLVLRTKEEFEAKLKDTERLLIDMPIGLEDEEYTRECDKLMRKELGSDYSSSVFSPPIRPALDAPSYVEANMISYEYNEKKLSLQAWNIVPKIKLLDSLLRANSELKNQIFESHPEHLFQKLNGGVIFQKKNLKKGVKHRLELISEFENKAVDFFREIKEEFRRNEVAEDDIVDAMALAIFAKRSYGQDPKTLPSQFTVDSEGLRKAYHYF